MAILPDLLKPDLRLVICGTAAGLTSAANRAYYAGPGNKFWRVLHQIGLTPSRIEARSYASLLDYGIGLTDLAKFASGLDAHLPSGCFDASGLWERIRMLQPRALAFNGKARGQHLLWRRNWHPDL